MQQMNKVYGQGNAIFNSDKSDKSGTSTGNENKVYGQYGQDSIIKQFFDIKNIKKGYFVDVGASEGTRINNSILLENNGWRGICIEAHPDYYSLLKKNRPNAKCVFAAVGDRDNVEVVINLNYRGSLTSLDFDNQSHFQTHYTEFYGDRDVKEIKGFRNGPYNINMRTLDNILKEHSSYFKKNPDLIMIDIDGSEKYAFKGLDLSKWTPTLLLLEHSVLGHDAVDAYAAQYGYIRARTMGADNIYTLNTEDKNIITSLSPVGEKYIIPHIADQR